ncbi:MAG: hypothetical protein ABSH28_18010 [Acidobacteriota bacterium]|jgi:hypothetical protein
MLFGREKEIEKLTLNLERGIHTLVFGIEGAGKTALLQEVVSRSSKIRLAYIRECSSRRALLEGALACLAADRAKTATPRSELLIMDLRDELIRAGRHGNACLILDHLPRLRHRMQHLLEILEQYFTMIFAVRAHPGAYDLYYWKFDRLEVVKLPDAAARSWIERDLGQRGCAGPLGRAIAAEVQRLCLGNPGLISDTLDAIRNDAASLDDPIRVRRLFVDGRLSHLKIRHASEHK